jgi:ligand-binding sensor domain-containing protein
VSRTWVILMLIFTAYSSLLLSCSNEADDWISYDDVNSSLSITTWQIVEDYQGNIWLAAGRLFFFDREQDKWLVMPVPLMEDYNGIRAIAFRRNNTLLVGLDRGLGQYNQPDNWRISSREENADNWDVRTILEDQMGQIWVGTARDGVFVSQDAGDSWKLAMLEGLPFFPVNQIYEDANGHLWIALNGGLYWYQPLSGEWRYFTDFTDRPDLVDSKGIALPEAEKALVSRIVYAISEDSNGVLWFGTLGGISSYDTLSDVWTNHTFDDHLNDTAVYSVQVDHMGKVWFGSESGAGWYDPNTGHWEFLKAKQGFTNFPTMDILIDRQGYVWFATFGNGVYRYKLQ